MSNDLDRFLRAVRTLSKLAWKYGDDAFLEALGRYATVKQEDEVRFVGTFLDGVGTELSKRRVERNPCCRQCGKQIESFFQATAKVFGVSAATIRRDTGDNDKRDDHRADAHYCSGKCRQRAYRSRVTASTSNPKRKRNVVTAIAVNAAASRNDDLRSNQVPAADDLAIPEFLRAAP